MAIDQPGEMAGGTAISKSIVSVTRLTKKFYSKKNPSTVIIVFTDAEEYGQWEGVKALPDDIKKNLVFIVMNQEPYFDQYIPNILAAGIPEKNIVPIDITTLPSL